MKALVFLLVASPALAADPIEGAWRTQPNDQGGVALVQIAPCGTGFCGTVTGDVDAQGRTTPSTMQGQTIIRNVVPEGDTYRGGRVLNPETGKSYAARLILDGDRLDVGGCVLKICRSGGVWTRAD